MRKRIISLLLAVVLLASMLPMSAAAVTPNSTKALIRDAAAKVVKAHAQKVYQPNADDDAFTDFTAHAFFGAHRKMVLNDGSAQTAALFNSYLLQESLAVGIAETIALAQELNKDQIYAFGSTGWHDFGYDYIYYGHLAPYGNVNQLRNIYPIGILTQAKDIYGKGLYSGPRNENDTVQELLTGTLQIVIGAKRMETKKDTAVYRIDLKLYDNFDFGPGYASSAEKGYDTSKDERLNNIGKLFTHLGIDEFVWEYSTTLQVEAPYRCDHQSASYGFNYVGETKTLSNVVTEDFAQNNVQKHYYESESWKDGVHTVTPATYYSMDETVILKHDQPWVVEYDWKVRQNMRLTPTVEGSCVNPNLYFNGTYIACFLYSDVKKLPLGESIQVDGKNVNSISDTHYVGVEISSYMKYSSKKEYRYRVENILNSDGSNMIYLTILDVDTQEVLLERKPMDDHWVRPYNEKERKLISESDPVLSGQDFYINYVGRRGYGLSDKGEFELRIWPNGTETAVNDSTSTKYTNPTCTRQGGMKKTCADCGYSWITDPIPALGHSYGAYSYDNNATCTENGTQTRICTRCGDKDTVMVPDTALGHDFGAYVFDNNAFCTDDGTESRHCSRCAAVETKIAPDTATGHSHQATVTAPTCTAQGYTTYTCHCGDKYVADYVDATGHSHQMTITAPTCTEQGYTTYTCHCGDTYKTDYTDAFGHSPVIDPAVPASCVGNGLTEGSHCGVCGYVIKAQTTVIGGTHLKDEGTIIKEPTTETPGTVMYQCIYCGEKSYVVIPKLEPIVNPFSDVKESDWFFKPVMWAVEKNVTGGKTATTFAPYEGCTRAQVVTFLWAANGKPTPTTAENPFTDISSADWYYNAVLWAVEQGITGGVSADKFGPNQTCTRAQIATFLWAAKGKPAVESGSEFSDVKDTDWFAAPVIWAKEQSITTGIGDGKFGPNDTCTRAQVVTFLNKVYG